jgi:3-deoxy-D-manno-octulosonic-acid transferase
MNFSYYIGIHIYGLLISIASLFSSKAKKRLIGQQQVFSLLESSLLNKAGASCIWFHAASLGEFEQGRPVMEALKKSNPACIILLTFFSPSGYEVRKNYNGADIVCYLPLDTPRNVKRFVDLVKPAKIIFIKYEFWPNFLSYCKKKQIPTYVISATFRKSQLFFKWYGWAYAKILKSFDTIYLQDETSRKLLKSIAVTNVVVAGDTRFDRVLEIAESKKNLPLIEDFKDNKQLIVMGSSWPKDEELMYQYMQKNLDVKLVIAPHVLSFDHLNEIESKVGVPIVRYSCANTNELKAARCLLIDNIGMLSSIYNYADIAYIGGGFGNGIHNILEAAVYNIPVVFGPNHQRFNEANELIILGGGFSVSDYSELHSAFDWLLIHKDAGRIAGDFVRQRKGATEKIIQGIFN